MWFSTAAMRPPMLQPRSYAPRTEGELPVPARAKRYRPGAAKALRLELALPARTAQSLGVTKVRCSRLAMTDGSLATEPQAATWREKCRSSPEAVHL